ncbi:hypothetical protein PMIT1323_02433 [Prochlorococcus marinus str. MIT 1323]|nr:hypothetical protein PMIT1323_02433 [Prochlorococcus marinus str. MIT 1323]
MSCKLFYYVYRCSATSFSAVYAVQQKLNNGAHGLINLCLICSRDQLLVNPLLMIEL